MDCRFLKILGINIVERRKQCGFTQEYLGAITNTNQDFISRIENNNIKHLNLERLEAIAKALHCPAADLFKMPENWKQETLIAITDENINKFADIVKPLSARDQKILLGTVAEMARLMVKDRKV